MKQPYNTALYYRLSRDDENFGDSVSIETQRTILQQFARDNQFHVVDEYIDDGWSGTNFDRPAFQRMMDDVDAGRINCIITKDLSRFGREHVMMDYYLEFVFPEKNIRYIAVTENEDTEKVPTSGWLNYTRYGTFAHIYADAPESKQYDWSIGQVKEILKDETYIGNSIHNKQTNISYKNKKKIRKPKEEWVRIENTHEAIISKDVFYHVQNQIASRRRKQKDGTTKIFSGLVKCADCGWSLAYGENRQNKTPYGHYHCSNYGQGTGKCSMHYVRYDTLYTYVLLRVQHWTKAVREDEERLLESILKAGDKERTVAMKKHTAELFKAEKRKAEVDRLFAKMYEDRVSERITEYNFNMLSQKYQMEQIELDEKIQKLKAALAESKQSVEDARKWIEIVKQYSEPTELTAEGNLHTDFSRDL